ncbi:hypothetical protein PR001_g18933 [Phytophthora rubi]|nr:hypothetical protein PR002_g18992 [Phytophthora rubi]KAE8999881.1 hypothetical protein PR001_g18933 [Phytophthora rubi]
MERFMEGHEDAHNIVIKEDLHWCKDARDSISTDAIRRCWQHAGLYVNRSKIDDILNP